METHVAWYESPVGWIRIGAIGQGICSLVFCEGKEETEVPCGILTECVSQLSLYFSGSLRQFSLPLAPEGTAFQRRVWEELVRIPYGEVITYRDLALRAGGESFTRVVGQANARNPVSLLIPCHRVVGKNGSLTGYAGGLWRKKFLLDLEQRGIRSGAAPTLF